MILFLKTDQEEAQVGLYKKEVIAEKKWKAHRELSDTLLKSIEEVLASKDLEWSDISGIIIFKGPGSFTGLRIGTTVANTLSESLSVPIVGSKGQDWLGTGVERINNSENEKIVMPEYGGEANITQPRK